MFLVIAKILHSTVEMPSHLNEQIETEPVLVHLIHRHTPHVDRLADNLPTWAPTEIIRMRCANSKLCRELEQQDPHLRIVVGHACVVDFIKDQLVRSQEEKIAEAHSNLALQRYGHGSPRYEALPHQDDMENDLWSEHSENAIDFDSDDESSFSEDCDEWSSDDDEGAIFIMESTQVPLRYIREEKRRAASTSAEAHGGFKVEVTELDAGNDA